MPLFDLSHRPLLQHCLAALIGTPLVAVPATLLLGPKLAALATLLFLGGVGKGYHDATHTA